jgi:hypothetical protein
MGVTRLMVVALAGWNYHRERNHQGLENRIIEPEFGSAEEGEVGCRERLGVTTGLELHLRGDQPKLKPAEVKKLLVLLEAALRKNLR